MESWVLPIMKTLWNVVNLDGNSSDLISNSELRGVSPNFLLSCSFHLRKAHLVEQSAKVDSMALGKTPREFADEMACV